MSLARPHLALLACGLLALSACGNVREDLGLGRNPPDEFAVADRPPLSMPPDFSLRPPQPGAARPQDIDASQRASEVLFSGQTPAAGSGLSNGERSLLEASGADKADPEIRHKVDRESAQKVVGSEHLVDELLWWKDDGKPATTVNAPAEAQRIKEAKDKGQSIDQGGTPVIERSKSGWLGL
jgi:hypothetical protein